MLREISSKLVVNDEAYSAHVT